MNAPLVIDAIYENGVLRPTQPLPLQEHEQVRITVQPAVDQVHASYGLLGWTGDPEIARKIALDDEFGILESP